MQGKCPPAPAPPLSVHHHLRQGGFFFHFLRAKAYAQTPTYATELFASKCFPKYQRSQVLQLYQLNGGSLSLAA